MISSEMETAESQNDIRIRSVLVVDDVQLNRKFVCKTLGKHADSLIKAENGLKAVAVEKVRE